MDQSYLRIRLKSCYRFQPYSMTEAKNVRTPMRIYVRKNIYFYKPKKKGSLPIVEESKHAENLVPRTQIKILWWEPGHVPGREIKPCIVDLLCKNHCQKIKK